ncbi:FG-GAP repeat domain-containing protein [Nanoarchaeota archaeon]
MEHKKITDLLLVSILILIIGTLIIPIFNLSGFVTVSEVEDCVKIAHIEQDGMIYGDYIEEIDWKLTNDDLNVLADGDYEYFPEEFEGYMQEIIFSSNSGQLIFEPNYEDINETLETYLALYSSEIFYAYELDFDQDLYYTPEWVESDIRYTTMEILGKIYTYVNVETEIGALNGASPGDIIELELMGGNRITLLNNDPVIFNIDGIDHEIELIGVYDEDPNYMDLCEISVDGSTEWVDEFTIENINNVNIGVILPWIHIQESDCYEIETQIECNAFTEDDCFWDSEWEVCDDLTWFDYSECLISVDANQIILSENEGVILDGQYIDDTLVNIDTYVDDWVNWDGFSIQYVSDDDTYIAEGENWVDPVFNTWTVNFDTLNNQPSETISIDIYGDNGYIEFLNTNSNSVEIPVLNYDGNIYLGDDYLDTPLGWVVQDGIGEPGQASGNLVIANGDFCAIDNSESSIDLEDMCDGLLLLVVSATGEARLLEIADLDIDGGTIDLNDLTTGVSWNDQSFGDIDLGFTTINIDDETGDFTPAFVGDRRIIFNSINNFSDNQMLSYYGAYIDISSNGNNIDFYNSNYDQLGSLNLIDDGFGDIIINNLDVTTYPIILNSDIEAGIDNANYGAVFEWDSDNKDELSLTYPENEVLSDVYVCGIEEEFENPNDPDGDGLNNYEDNCPDDYNPITEIENKYTFVETYNKKAYYSLQDEIAPDMKDLPNETEFTDNCNVIEFGPFTANSENGKTKEKIKDKPLLKALSLTEPESYCQIAEEDECGDYYDDCGHAITDMPIEFYNLNEITYDWDIIDTSDIVVSFSGDDEDKQYNLPWNFSFYGVDYDTILVDTNGNIWLPNQCDGYCTYGDEDMLSNYSVIAAWNLDLSSSYYGEVIIFYNETEDVVIVEWYTEAYSDGGYEYMNLFQVLLYPDGTIRFNYDYFDCDSCYDEGSGVGMGDNIHSSSLTNQFDDVYNLGGTSYIFEYSGNGLNQNGIGYSITNVTYDYLEVPEPTTITLSGDDEGREYDLPWTFEFYGEEHDTVLFDTNGNLWLPYDQCEEYCTYGSEGMLAEYGVISIWNDDLDSGDYGLVVVENKTNPNRVIFNWETETYSDGGDNLLNLFQIILFENGTIRYNYNYFNCDSCDDDGSGVGKGDEKSITSITDQFDYVYNLAQRSFEFNYDIIEVEMYNTQRYIFELSEENVDEIEILWEGSYYSQSGMAPTIFIFIWNDYYEVWEELDELYYFEIDDNEYYHSEEFEGDIDEYITENNEVIILVQSNYDYGYDEPEILSTDYIVLYAYTYDIQSDLDFDGIGDECDDEPCGPNTELGEIILNRGIKTTDIHDEDGCICEESYHNLDGKWSNGCEWTRDDYLLYSNYAETTPKIDGVIDDGEWDDANLTQFWFVPTSDHPEGYIYIYAKNDIDYLYFLLDVTPDNTWDGDDYCGYMIDLDYDYDYDIEAYLQAYDDPSFDEAIGFGTSPNAGYDHRICEFKLSRDNLLDFFFRSMNDIDLSLEMGIAFHGYGTLSPEWTWPINIPIFDAEYYGDLILADFFPSKPIIGWEFETGSTVYDTVTGDINNDGFADVAAITIEDEYGYCPDQCEYSEGYCEDSFDCTTITNNTICEDYSPICEVLNLTGELECFNSGFCEGECQDIYECCDAFSPECSWVGEIPDCDGVCYTCEWCEMASVYAIDNEGVGLWANHDYSGKRIDATDFDGDGNLEIIAGGNLEDYYLEILDNTGDEWESLNPISLNSRLNAQQFLEDCDGYVKDIETADLDGDGIEDIIIGDDCEGGWIEAFGINESMYWYWEEYFISAIATGELYGNDTKDIATIHYPYGFGECEEFCNPFDCEEGCSGCEWCGCAEYCEPMDCIEECSECPWCECEGYCEPMDCGLDCNSCPWCGDTIRTFEGETGMPLETVYWSGQAIEIGDVNGDGIDEIVVGVDMSIEEVSINNLVAQNGEGSDTDYFIIVFDKDMEEMLGYYPTQNLIVDIELGELSSDYAGKEIVAISSPSVSRSYDSTTYVLAGLAEEEEYLPLLWIKPHSGYNDGPREIDLLRIADINEDGNNEVIIGDYKGYIHTYSNTGEKIISFNMNLLAIEFDAQQHIPEDPILDVEVTDLNNDGISDVIIAIGNKIYGIPGISVEEEFYSEIVETIAEIVTEIDAREEDVDISMEIVTTDGVTGSIDFIEHGDNPTEANFGVEGLKYVDIEASAEIKDNIGWIMIYIYYTDEEIAVAGLDESTLRIYYYNETLDDWVVEADSGVNITGNYVWANITHLSIFGTGGSAPSTPSSGRRSSSPSCLWECTDWSECSSDGKQTRTCGAGAEHCSSLESYTENRGCVYIPQEIIPEDPKEEIDEEEPEEQETEDDISKEVEDQKEEIEKEPIIIEEPKKEPSTLIKGIDDEILAIVIGLFVLLLITLIIINIFSTHEVKIHEAPIKVEKKIEKVDLKQARIKTQKIEKPIYKPVKKIEAPKKPVAKKTEMQVINEKMKEIMDDLKKI